MFWRLQMNFLLFFSWFFFYYSICSIYLVCCSEQLFCPRNHHLFPPVHLPHTIDLFSLDLFFWFSKVYFLCFLIFFRSNETFSFFYCSNHHLFTPCKCSIEQQISSRQDSSHWTWWCFIVCRCPFGFMCSVWVGVLSLNQLRWRWATVDPSSVVNNASLNQQAVCSKLLNPMLPDFYRGKRPSWFKSYREERLSSCLLVLIGDWKQITASMLAVLLPGISRYRIYSRSIGSCFIGLDTIEKGS